MMRDGIIMRSPMILAYKRRVDKHRRVIVGHVHTGLFLWRDGTWFRSAGRRPGYDDGGGYFNKQDEVDLALCKSLLLDWPGIPEGRL